MLDLGVILGKATNIIAKNKRAWFDYEIFEQFEAGLVLYGWEVKSIRAGRAQIKESHITIKQNEVWCIYSHISPLPTASTHVETDERRRRKLLLKRKQINTLIGAVERKGFTIVPLELYWQNNKIKLKIALARGKKKYDKRAALKEQDVNRKLQQKYN